MEKDLTYEKLYSVNTSKPSTNMNTTQRNQIELVIKALDNWRNNLRKLKLYDRCYFLRNNYILSNQKRPVH